MKIYDFNENFIIKKLQKKEKQMIFTNSNYNFSKINVKLSGELTLVELLACNKVFVCDTVICRGNSLICTVLGESYVSIVDVVTGNLTKARTVDFYGDMMIVTLENNSRRFIDKDGKIKDAEVGAGGFQQEVNSALKVFVDENGNSAGITNPYFVGLNGRVRSGEEDVIAKGVYSAKTHHEKETVYYSFLGNEIKHEEIRMYRDLYQFYKGEKKLSELSNTYLLNATVYNFIVDEVNRRLQNKFEESEKIKGYYDKTTQQVLDKLAKTLNELEDRRQLALENTVNQTLSKTTFDN